MKKTLIIIAIIIMALTTTKKQVISIPKEAIRFRVIANSNNVTDQILKEEITNNIYKEFSSLNFKEKNIASIRNDIKSKIPLIEKIVENTIESKGLKKEYNINYGMNYFPEKQYKGILYEEGEYESLVITIGDGLGDNFWCVLFPPLCLLEAEEKDTSEVEYTSFIKEVLEKYF